MLLYVHTNEFFLTVAKSALQDERVPNFSSLCHGAKMIRVSYVRLLLSRGEAGGGGCSFIPLPGTHLSQLFEDRAISLSLIGKSLLKSVDKLMEKQLLLSISSS